MTKKMSSVISSSSQPASSATSAVAVMMNGFMSNISGIVSNKKMMNLSETKMNCQNQLAVTRNGNSNNTEIVMPYHPRPTKIFTTVSSFPETHPATMTAFENLHDYSRQQQQSLDVEEIDTINSGEEELKSNLSVWMISTLKRRKKKMNKHKLRKRRKLLRLKSKK